MDEPSEAMDAIFIPELINNSIAIPQRPKGGFQQKIVLLSDGEWFSNLGSWKMNNYTLYILNVMENCKFKTTENIRDWENGSDMMDVMLDNNLSAYKIADRDQGQRLDLKFKTQVCGLLNMSRRKNLMKFWKLGKKKNLSLMRSDICKIAWWCKICARFTDDLSCKLNNYALKTGCCFDSF